jgi:TIR domain-containing protein
MADYTIFLSHRSKDALAAGQLRAILEGLDDSDALRVVVSEAFPKGDDWRTSIHKELAQADRFVLLYTDPSQKWDWCLYESGFFTGARLNRPKPSAKFITLHAVDVEPPSPLMQWQTVKGDAAAIRELLEELFCVPLRERATPIAKKLKGSRRIKVAAERIAVLIRPGPKPDWYSSFVRVILTPEQIEQAKAQRRIPSEAVVESDDSALDLFNVKRNGGLNW